MIPPPPTVTTFTSQGYSVNPCPGCGIACKPGERRAVVHGEWLPWHEECYNPPACLYCGDKHSMPRDGRCLI